MSWLASTIEPIIRYGWGAAVFAGLAVICILLLAISAALFAWRYFRPLNVAERPALPGPVFQRSDFGISLTRAPQTQTDLSDTVVLIVYGFETELSRPSVPEEEARDAARLALAESANRSIDWRLSVLSANTSNVDLTTPCIERGDLTREDVDGVSRLTLTKYGRSRARVLIKEMMKPNPVAPP